MVKEINQFEQINMIKESIDKSSSITGKQELIGMLDDVQSKLKAGEKIPAYLTKAIKEKLAKEPALIKKLLSIIE